MTRILVMRDPGRKRSRADCGIVSFEARYLEETMSSSSLDWFWTAFAAAMSGTMCLAYMIPITLAIATTIIWIVALLDVVQRADYEFPNARAGRFDPNERLLWVLIVMLGSLVGSVIYYVVVMK